MGWNACGAGCAGRSDDAPEGKRGPQLFAVQTMLRIHCTHKWFTLSGPAMEESLHDMPL